ncbi:MAG TPA: hypothetical protein VG994_17105 [Steroidobacteraceae bacterium]|nr:hypothetical protein [Steroidobacteraceae bacterium]
MITAIIVIVVVCALLAGTVLNLRRSANRGMPPPDVLKRATERARMLAAQEEAEQRR